MRTRVRIAVAMLVMVVSAGCTVGPGGISGRKISELRPTEPHFLVMEQRVSKQDFLTALGRDPENSQLRIVEVYFGSGQVSPAYPNYRIFGVNPLSAHAVLGLRNGDVLVAANGYVVASPAVFRQYVQLLGREREAQIELIRHGNPTLLKVTFVEGSGKAADASGDGRP